jgi:hypothetical protein
MRRDMAFLIECINIFSYIFNPSVLVTEELNTTLECLYIQLRRQNGWDNLCVFPAKDNLLCIALSFFNAFLVLAVQLGTTKSHKLQLRLFFCHSKIILYGLLTS